MTGSSSAGVRGGLIERPSKADLQRFVRQENRKYNSQSFADRDLMKMAENLYDVYDFLQDAKEGYEVRTRWEPDLHHDLEANRIHLQGCGGCSNTYLALTNGVETIYLPPHLAYQLAYDDYEEVVGRETPEERKRRILKSSQVGSF